MKIVTDIFIGTKEDFFFSLSINKMKY